MWMLERFRPRPVRKFSSQPTVSIVIAVHNGAALLEGKLDNLSQLAYPKELLEIIIASDGSNDGTAEILNSARGVRAMICPRVGKAEALNRALAVSRNEIVVFADVRQKIHPDAIANLVQNFADSEVGCVSGELIFLSSENGVSGVSTYWKFEKVLRKSESASGSVMGATGALYAVRRSLVPLIPIGTLLDDVYVPLKVLQQGKRVVFEPHAIVWDTVAKKSGLEFSRKVRTLAGNFQILELMPQVLTDPAMRFRFVSHKLTRLLAPWLLLIVFVLSWLQVHSTFYLILAVAQAVFYGMAILALLPRFNAGRVVPAVKAFCLMNAAAAVALFSYLRHRRDLMRIWNVPSAAITSASRAAQPTRVAK
jgi:cellulose synthase/poly-beta-1,6-N-acetylglucosamine synthase-like glycosyltransferase